MIDQDLREELAAAVERVGGIDALPEEDAKDRIQKLAASFVADSRHRWWWESITGPSKRIGYGGTDGLSILAKLVNPASRVDIVVTDDAEPPWPVYSGSMKSIMRILRECRFFEYILAAQDGSWIVFDTHMNELVVAGQLAQAGPEEQEQ